MCWRVESLKNTSLWLSSNETGYSTFFLASYTPFKPGSRPRSEVTSSPPPGSLLVTKVYRTEVDTSCCVHWQTDWNCRKHTNPLTVLGNQPAGDWNPTSPLERVHRNFYHLALHGGGYHPPLPVTENLLRVPFLSQAFPHTNVRGWSWHDQVWCLGSGRGDWKKSLT